MTLYTSHVESIRNVTQLAGMIFQFPPTSRSTTGLNQALVVYFRVEPCQIRGPIFDDTPSGPCIRRGILLKQLRFYCSEKGSNLSSLFASFGF